MWFFYIRAKQAVKLLEEGALKSVAVYKKSMDNKSLKICRCQIINWDNYYE